MVDFWERHYQSFQLLEPSGFALEMLRTEIDASDTVVELGCGNGRDALIFCGNVQRYLGIDSSAEAIERAAAALDSNRVQSEACNLLLGDFTNFDFEQLASQCMTSGTRLIIYSRFTMHSIDARAEQRLFDSLAAVAVGKLVVLIEARTIHDALYGVGHSAGNRAFVTDHYRRFIDPEEFSESRSKAFHVNWLRVGNGYAPLGEEDPIVMRTKLTLRSARFED